MVSAGGVLRFGLDRGVQLEPQNPYPISKAWKPNLAATFCHQPHKQASSQGYNNKSNNKASAVAGRRFWDQSWGRIKLQSLRVILVVNGTYF